MKLKNIFFAIIGGAIIMLALFLNHNLDRWQAETSLRDSAPDSDLMTPYWELSPEQQEDSEAKVKILNQRAEELFYGHSVYYGTYYFSHEFRNQLFHRAFPETHLYVIWYDTGDVCPEDPCPTTGRIMMASRQGVDYHMLEDFSQLLMDADYQLPEENRDLLAYALILVTLPVGKAQQSLYCGEGYEIDNDLEYIHLTYAIDCQIEDITNVTAWFSELEITPQRQMYQGSVSWGDLTENGWRESIRNANYYSLTTP